MCIFRVWTTWYHLSHYVLNDEWRYNAKKWSHFLYNLFLFHFQILPFASWKQEGKSGMLLCNPYVENELNIKNTGKPWIIKVLLQMEFLRLLVYCNIEMFIHSNLSQSDPKMYVQEKLEPEFLRLTRSKLKIDDWNVII